MIRNIFVYILLLLGVLIARLMTADTLMHYYAFQLIIYMMLLYPGVQLLYVIFTRCAIRAQLQLDKEAVCKRQNVEYKLQLQNRSILPVAYGRVCVEWRNALTGDRKIEKIPFSILPKDTINIGGTHTCNQCGCIMAYVKRIEVYDMLRMWRMWRGFYPFRKSVMEKTKTSIHNPSMKNKLGINAQSISELVVMPAVSGTMEVDSEEFPQDVSETENTKWMKPDESAREMIEIREYRAGDKIQKIHWKASAKMDSVMVRQMGETMNEQSCVFFEHYIPYRKKADYFDKMLEIFVALSKTMVESGQEFQIAWCQQEHLVLRRIHNQSELWKAMKLMMKQESAKEAKGISVLARERKIKDMNLYYIATGWNNQEDKVFQKLLDKTKLAIYLIDDYEKREVSEHVAKLMRRTKNACVWKLISSER